MANREFQVGDRVVHPEFGEGLVLQASGAGDAATLLVSFADKSQRKLRARLANLRLAGSEPTADAET